MTEPLRVLLVEDNVDDAELVIRCLERAGHEVVYERVETGDRFAQQLEGQRWDVVISDHVVPGFGSDAALRIVRSGHHDVPFIVVSGRIGEEAAVEALKAGADDYVMKDRLARLPPAVARAISHRALEQRQRQHDAEVLRAHAIESLGTVAAGIAHDVNNVLTAVLVNVQLAQMLHPEPALAEHLDQAYLAAERGRDLLRRTLALGGPDHTVREAVRPAMVAEEVVSLLRAGLPSGIRISVEVSPDAPDILADRTQLFQMLMNLATNAVQAIETGIGAVTIRVARVRLSADYQPVASLPDGDYLLLQVVDTGKGMDRVTAGRIFEPFFTTKPKGHGSGLGLAAVHHMVQQHGGAIGAVSEPGRGATFSIYLPVTDIAEVAVPDAPAAVPEVRPAPARVRTLAPDAKHVLYVEDEFLVALATRRYLESIGYVVLEARSSQEALDLVVSGRAQVDLVLTDERLPGMCGSEMAAVLADVRADLPVVIASGVKPVEAALVLPNVCQWLSKPYSDQALARALASALARPAARH